MPDDTTIDALTEELVNGLTPATHRAAPLAYVMMEVSVADLRTGVKATLEKLSQAVAEPLAAQLADRDKEIATLRESNEQLTVSNRDLTGLLADARKPEVPVTDEAAPPPQAG